MARDLIVIPARWGSTRLPGKPLRPIAGRTLLSRVVQIAQRAAALAGGAEVLVATDDARIEAHAREIGATAVVTDAGVSTGSGRALAAARLVGASAERLVNLQGDAPFTAPETVATLIQAMRSAPDPVATPVVRLGWEALDALRAHKRVAPFSGTTCVVNPDGLALWFSKAVLPQIRNEPALRRAGGLSPVLQHIGLYAYRLDALALYEAAAPSRYEQLEGLEQLRFLELGMPIRAIEIAAPKFAPTGIDTIEDVRRAEAAIAAHGDPFNQ